MSDLDRREARARGLVVEDVPRGVVVSLALVVLGPALVLVLGAVGFFPQLAVLVVAIAAAPLYRWGAGGRPRAGLVPLLLLVLVATGVSWVVDVLLVVEEYDQATSVWMYGGLALVGLVMGGMTMYGERRP